MSQEVSAEAVALDGCLAWAVRRFGPGYVLSAVRLHVTGPDGVTLTIALDPAAYLLRRLQPPPAELPPARHSPDFRSVYWYGTVYTFGPLQAAVVKVLWEAWENGTPDVGGDYLLEHSGSDRECKRLDAAFAGCPAWGEMITSEKKGAYRLSPPSGRGHGQ